MTVFPHSMPPREAGGLYPISRYCIPTYTHIRPFLNNLNVKGSGIVLEDLKITIRVQREARRRGPEQVLFKLGPAVTDVNSLEMNPGFQPFGLDKEHPYILDYERFNGTPNLHCIGIVGVGHISDDFGETMKRYFIFQNSWGEDFANGRYDREFDQSLPSPGRDLFP